MGVAQKLIITQFLSKNVDFHREFEDVKIKSYADDTHLLVKAKTVEHLSVELEQK